MTPEEVVERFHERCSWNRLVPTWHLPTLLEQLARSGAGAIEQAIAIDLGNTESSRATYRLVIAFAAGLALIDIDYPKAQEQTSLTAAFWDWGSVSGLRLGASFAPDDDRMSRWSLHLASPELDVNSSRANPDQDLLRLSDALLRHLKRPAAEE